MICQEMCPIWTCFIFPVANARGRRGPNALHTPHTPRYGPGISLHKNTLIHMYLYDRLWKLTTYFHQHFICTSIVIIIFIYKYLFIYVYLFIYIYAFNYHFYSPDFVKSPSSPFHSQNSSSKASCNPRQVFHAGHIILQFSASKADAVPSSQQSLMEAEAGVRDGGKSWRQVMSECKEFEYCAAAAVDINRK